MTITKPSSSKMRELAFTPAQHHIWETLYTRQMPNIRQHACRDFLEGLEILDLRPERIPSINELNAKITPPTGWKVVHTKVRYSDAVPWYHHFARKQFMVTDYLRTWEELDFTPEPDMFHDILGHLPFMVLPHYTAVQEMFAAPFLRGDTEQRENIKRLAWFSTEFGLIEEEGEVKIFGAGLVSSKGELEKVMSGKTELMPFTIENVLNHDKAIWSFNETLFVFRSIDELKGELARYFDGI